MNCGKVLAKQLDGLMDNLRMQTITEVQLMIRGWYMEKMNDVFPESDLEELLEAIKFDKRVIPNG